MYFQPLWRYDIKYSVGKILNARDDKMLVYSNDMGGMLSQEEIDKLIKKMEEEKEKNS